MPHTLGHAAHVIWERVTAILAVDDAFNSLEEPDGRRVAAQVALDFVMYAQVGAAGVAVMNRAVSARDRRDLIEWAHRDGVALAFSRAAEALDGGIR